MIAEYWNGLGSDDFHNIVEELYVTAKGNYFLHGSGGPNTEYRVDTGTNSFCGSSTIIPLSKEEAYNWAEKRDKPEVILKHFSDFIEEA